MTDTKLVELMQQGARTQRLDALDLVAIRRRGGRIRLRRRAGLGATALAVAGIVAGGLALSGQLGSAGTTVAQPTAADHQVTALTPYEKRVLAEVPGAFEVDGTVIVPGSAATEPSQLIRPKLVGEPIKALGFHSYAGGALMNPDLPAFMRAKNPPPDSQVLSDRGPASIGCTKWPQEHLDCEVSVLGRVAGHTFYEEGLGTEDFLKPGAEMQVFTADDYTDQTWHASVIGGFDGTTATKVAITMVDGKVADATIDSGDISSGDTLFWASLPAEAASVTAYDANGQVVAQHVVRACDSAADCEVR